LPWVVLLILTHCELLTAGLLRKPGIEVVCDSNATTCVQCRRSPMSTAPVKTGFGQINCPG